MRNAPLPIPALLVGLATLAAGPAAAHEFVLLPERLEAGAGEEIGFEVHSTHVLGMPEEMERAESVAVRLVGAAGAEAIAVAEEPEAHRLVGTAASDGGTAWLAAHRLGQVWSRTPQGWVEGGRDVAPDADFTNKYEKFVKVLLNGGDAALATRPIGDALEIVPLADPAGLAAGETLELQVLHEGRPVEAQIAATFLGFSDLPGTYAYLTETRESEAGPVATLAPWAPGLWAVRVQHEAEAPGIDAHVLRAVMMVPVE